MPALLVAQRMQEKASRIGFDWEKIDDVWEKVKEEIAELEREIHSDDTEKFEDELGDILFVLTNLARFKGVNAEMALRRTNEKFARRFRYVEKKLKEENIDLPTLEIMDRFWDEAKEME